MTKVKRNYELPEKVVKKLEEFSERTGISIQRLVAVGAVMACELDATERDMVQKGFLDWLKGDHHSVAPTIMVVNPRALVAFSDNCKYRPVMSGFKDIIYEALIAAESLTEKQWDDLDAEYDRRHGMKPWVYADEEARPVRPDAHAAVDQVRSRRKQTRRQA